MLPPPILQYFNNLLLSRPMPKFYDDSETLWKIYQYIKSKLFKKAKNCPRRMEKLLILEQQFLEEYGIAKAKEEDIKAKTGKPAKGPFYYIGCITRKNEKIFSRIRFK